MGIEISLHMILLRFVGSVVAISSSLCRKRFIPWNVTFLFEVNSLAPLIPGLVFCAVHLPLFATICRFAR